MESAFSTGVILEIKKKEIINLDCFAYTLLNLG